MDSNFIFKYVVALSHLFDRVIRRAWRSTDDACTVVFLPRTYDERSDKGAEPHERWLYLVVRSSGSKVQRREDLEGLCRCIDFRQLHLLDDTVTEVFIAKNCDAQSTRLPCKAQPNPENEYSSVISHLWARTQEDSRRVRYPTYDSASGILTRDRSEIEVKEEEELHGGVYKVRLLADDNIYVYKQVERPFYVAGDSDVLEQELRNLEILRSGDAGVVQLVAAVTSINPYQTAPEQSSGRCGSAVLRGLLLEYHPNGTLEMALKSPSLDMDGRWRRWGLQITKALACLHERGIAHMDLKPSNVVISADMNAVLIDVSGIGGVTRQWLSPEMLQSKDPMSQDFEARKQNDIWALGQILLAMAEASSNSDEERLLRSISLSTTRTPPRIPLSEAIRSFPECLS
ncbi:kinase-like domain-containing protein [Chaetomium tenue]|uniref:Kinase-like domain-containing protein n=1 Tax=Chaetomium tenue TaxID=1854479 RepID=A0ACB7PAX6_9PEZI|nr:kinase-like domain-containing protein [Chaetomium globosum]